MVESVATALKALPGDPKDTAAIALAEQYAERIDSGYGDTDPLAVYGPKLLAVLMELGLTPKARAAALKGDKDDAPDAGGINPANELRARRAARLAGAATVDAPAP